MILLVTQAIVGLLIFLALGELSDASLWTRVATSAAPFAAWPVIFAIRVVTVPAAMDAELRTRIRPGPGDETPLFHVTECWWNQLPTSPPTRQAYLTIEFARDIVEGQLRVWGFENQLRFLIDGQQNVTGMRGQNLRIPLATCCVFDRSIPHRWGEDGKTLSENALSLALIEMQIGKHRQEYRVLITAMFTGEQCELHVVSPEWNPYFWPDLPGTLPGT